jgi:hypothetical protein
MVEVDWNSLFASFFGMVRIKIAYKDVSKITRKRMFEMKKLYVIQFKVEEESEIHGGVGGGNDDDDNGKRDGEDPGIEEIEHDIVHDGTLPKGGSNNSKDKGQNSGNSSSPTGCRKVADWASLFLSRNENSKLMGSAIGQYSCTNLLKELDAANSESEEENFMLVDGDDELIKVPDSWLEKMENRDENHGLPDNPFDSPEFSRNREMKQVE